MHTEGQPCEDTGRRQLSTHQGERLQENQPCPHLEPRLPASEGWGEINVWCLSCPVCGICYSAQADRG